MGEGGGSVVVVSREKGEGVKKLLSKKARSRKEGRDF